MLKEGKIRESIGARDEEVSYPKLLILIYSKATKPSKKDINRQMGIPGDKKKLVSYRTYELYNQGT